MIHLNVSFFYFLFLSSSHQLYLLLVSLSYTLFHIHSLLYLRWPHLSAFLSIATFTFDMLLRQTLLHPTSLTLHLRPTCAERAVWWVLHLDDGEGRVTNREVPELDLQDKESHHVILLPNFGSLCLWTSPSSLLHSLFICWMSSTGLRHATVGSSLKKLKLREVPLLHWR